MLDISLSVLVTFYNQEKYVDEALGSIFSQKCSYKYEVLIADDGSSDHTVDKIHEWMKKYPNISLFIMDRDQTKKYASIARVSNARLRLLKEAKGEYLIFLDGDDYFARDDKFEKQLSFLYSHLECNMCASRFNFSTDLDTSKDTGKFKVLSNKEYWKYYYLSAATFVIKRDDDIKVDNDNFDDNTIIYPFLKKAKMAYLDEVTFIYRQENSGTWKSFTNLERDTVNLNDYCFEIRSNPKFKRISLFRHVAELVDMFNFKNTQDVAPKYLDVFKSNSYINGIIHYNELSFAKRFILNIKYLYYASLLFYKKVMLKLFKGRIIK